MTDRARLVEQLRVAEGVRHTAYRDSLGYWTAGVGHLLDQSKSWAGTVFSDDQINEWLEADIDAALAQAQQLPEWQALQTDARQNAVVELVFNLGLAHWKLFCRCRLCLCQGCWQCAHDELLNSRWAQQVGPARATRIATMLLTGEF